MPCLIITGHPCAGKTTVAQLFRERAAQKFGRIELINEESACPDHTKSSCYKDSYTEKKTRAALKSAFDRTVAASDGSTLIILDSLNYIKGFRYELFCISKAANERHGIVWVLNDTATIKKWNSERGEAYTDAQMEELILRYEPPDSRNRWDQPLYRVDMRQNNSTTASDVDALQQSVYNMHNLSDALSKPDTIDADPLQTSSPQKETTKTSTLKKRSTFRRATKATASVTDTEQPNSLQDANAVVTTVASGTTDRHQTPNIPEKQQSLEERIDEILEQLLSNVKPLEEGMSTRQQIATDANVLQNVDALTQRICSAIMNAQGMVKVEVPASIDKTETITWEAPSTRTVPSTELKRIRRQFVQWSQKNPPDDPSEMGIATSFLAYLTEALR